MRPRRSVLLIPPKAACVSNSFPFKWLPTLSCPERRRGLRSRSISFVFKSLRTLFRNGALSTPFPSITSALFPMQWGVGVHRHHGTSILPYILPSSVSSKSRVFTLLRKLPGWGVLLPILVHAELRGGPRQSVAQGSRILVRKGRTHYARRSSL